ALFAPAASAALDGPQAEYRSRVEPICQAEGEAKERIEAPGTGHPLPQSARLKRTGRGFVRQADALGGSLGKLRRVSRPDLDAALMGKWLDLISSQATLLRKAGNAAIDGQAGQAQKLINRFTGGSRKANNLVVSYEFRHCVFEGAGFTP